MQSSNIHTITPSWPPLDYDRYAQDDGRYTYRLSHPPTLYWPEADPAKRDPSTSALCDLLAVISAPHGTHSHWKACHENRAIIITYWANGFSVELGHPETPLQPPSRSLVLGEEHSARVFYKGEGWAFHPWGEGAAGPPVPPTAVAREAFVQHVRDRRALGCPEVLPAADFAAPFLHSPRPGSLGFPSVADFPDAVVAAARQLLPPAEQDSLRFLPWRLVNQMTPAKHRKMCHGALLGAPSAAPVVGAGAEGGGGGGGGGCSEVGSSSSSSGGGSSGESTEPPHAATAAAAPAEAPAGGDVIAAPSPPPTFAPPSDAAAPSAAAVEGGAPPPLLLRVTVAADHEHTDSPRSAGAQGVSGATSAADGLSATLLALKSAATPSPPLDAADGATVALSIVCSPANIAEVSVYSNGLL